jgi:hypothetical protein
VPVRTPLPCRRKLTDTALEQIFTIEHEEVQRFHAFADTVQMTEANTG